jgi:hypothetical protein
MPGTTERVGDDPAVSQGYCVGGRAANLIDQRAAGERRPRVELRDATRGGGVLIQP